MPINEITAPVGGGTVTINVDMAVLTSFLLAAQGLSATVARQIVAIGDPQDATRVASVLTAPVAGNEPALVAKLGSGNADLPDIVQELRMLRLDLQSLVTAMGGLVLAPAPMI